MLISTAKAAAKIHGNIKVRLCIHTLIAHINSEGCCKDTQKYKGKNVHTHTHSAHINSEGCCKDTRKCKGKKVHTHTQCFNINSKGCCKDTRKYKGYVYTHGNIKLKDVIHILCNSKERIYSDHGKSSPRRLAMTSQYKKNLNSFIFNKIHIPACL